VSGKTPNQIWSIAVISTLAGAGLCQASIMDLFQEQLDDILAKQSVLLDRFKDLAKEFKRGGVEIPRDLVVELDDLINETNT
jgi:hypothetical protein